MRERIFITVKTYPNLSSKHGELVCTAGINEQGEWRRIYPVQFRFMDPNDQYSKYQWITVELGSASPGDPRPESRKLVSILENNPADSITDPLQRWKIISGRTPIYYSKMELLKDMREKGTSLAIFKPTEIQTMDYEETTAEWTENKLAAFRKFQQQYSLFSTPEEHERRFLQEAKKIPYYFRYHFTDCDGIPSHLMVEDWEIGMLYLNSLKSPRFSTPEAAAEQTAKRYMEYAKTRDIYFFLGTSLERQNKNAQNPFIIVGVFYNLKLPKEDDQMRLF